MFLTVKRKWIILLLCLAVLFVGVGIFFKVQSTTAKPNLQKTIVIDAGHGGKDGGAVGRQTGITESALNLEYSLYLKELFEQFGFRVVLTRTDMGGLYSPLASNKKKSEMEKRRKIIEKANPSFVISVHMNSFATIEGRGAQVFYGKADSSGETLAQRVQTSLNHQIEYAKKTAKVGDYYILNAIDSPAILIECGYLSNPQEELLLQEEKYMHKFCYCVLCGVLSYFDFS